MRFKIFTPPIILWHFREVLISPWSVAVFLLLWLFFVGVVFYVIVFGDFFLLLLLLLLLLFLLLSFLSLFFAVFVVGWVFRRHLDIIKRKGEAGCSCVVRVYFLFHSIRPLEVEIFQMDMLANGSFKMSWLRCTNSIIVWSSGLDSLFDSLYLWTHGYQFTNGSSNVGTRPWGSRFTDGPSWQCN